MSNTHTRIGRDNNGEITVNGAIVSAQSIKVARILLAQEEKILAIWTIRAASDRTIGLKEAKDFVDCLRDQMAGRVVRYITDVNIF